MNNARRNKNPSNRRNENRSTEQVKLGTLIHIVEKQPVIALVSQDIPYPNSPVLLNDKVIGKIDEVLGTLEKAYASVTLDKDIAIEPETMFYGYKDKFIMKKRFLPRDDVEKKKEENDKSQKRQSSGNRYDKKSYEDRKGSSRSYNDHDRGSKRSYNDHDRGSKRSYNDHDRGSKRSYNDQDRGNKRFKK